MERQASGQRQRLGLRQRQASGQRQRLGLRQRQAGPGLPVEGIAQRCDGVEAVVAAAQLQQHQYGAARCWWRRQQRRWQLKWRTASIDAACSQGGTGGAGEQQREQGAALHLMVMPVATQGRQTGPRGWRGWAPPVGQGPGVESG